MEIKTLSLKNPKVKAFYDMSLKRMKKQYKDVVTIKELHVNKDNKVFSGEWLDSKGVSNFCGGWVVDCVKVIRFKENNV